MSFKFKTYADILEEILIDYRGQLEGASTSDTNKIYIKAVALASSLWGEYKNQYDIYRQIFPDSADSEELQRHALTYAISRLASGKASGAVNLSGQDDTAVPSGTQIAAADGTPYITIADASIIDGAASVNVRAVIGGVAGNQAAGAKLVIQSAIPGLDGTATVGDAGITGGVDSEADAGLLGRLLNRIQQPPAGGNDNDYKTWAEEVPGVAIAFPYALRQGLGSITVLILTFGTGADRIPGPDLVAAVQAHIDSLRPGNYKYMQVLAPTAHEDDVSVLYTEMDGYAREVVEGWIQVAISAYYGALKPLETRYLSKLNAIISDTEGVKDFILVAPIANLVPTDDSRAVAEMITLGGITFGAL